MWRTGQSTAGAWDGFLAAAKQVAANPVAHLGADWRKQLPFWTAAVLAVLLGVDLARDAWQLRLNGPLLGPLRSGTYPPLKQAPFGQQPKIPQFDVQPLVDGHLFGAPPKSVPAGADANSAPDTRLALSLSGIIATKDPQKGYAILGEQGKVAHFYGVGAALEVPGGGRLFRVFVDRVVLDFDGRLETLRLPRNQLPVATPPAIRAASAEATAAPTQESPAAAVLANEIVTPAQSSFALLYAERHNVDGHMDGMVLHPPKRYLRQYGLRDGDTLTAVNGVTLTDPDDLANALKGAGKSLSLTFVRDGVQLTKTLPVGQ